LPRESRHRLGSPRRQHLARNLEACVRAPPLRLQHAGATFIMLDNVHYFGYNPARPRAAATAGRSASSSCNSCATCWPMFRRSSSWSCRCTFRL
jgi:hypothetical protein